MNQFPADTALLDPSCRPARLRRARLPAALLVALAVLPGCVTSSADGGATVNPPVADAPAIVPGATVVKPSAPSSAVPPVLACAPDNAPALTNSLLTATNTARTNARTNALAVAPTLAGIAQAHACEMAARGTLGHVGANGSSVKDRAQAAGFNACAIAENIAAGQPGVAGVMAAWRASAEHRANMMHPGYRDAGFGVARGADGKLWWVGVYGRKC